MLLKRDIAAVLIAVVLSHIAWNRQELQSASVHLSFYLSHRRNGPRDVMNPAIMDIDGDELPDTLVHILLENEDTWKIKVMDIQSEHRGKRGRTSAAAVPFQPAVVLESPPILGKDIHPKDIPEFAAPLMPLKMTVGHVSLKGGAGGGSKSWNQKNKVGSADNKRNTQEISERNRKMFCGSDWHHAAKCRKPCPSGSSADCPEDERCFADTPCDYYTYQKEREQQTQKKDDLTVEMESLLADTRNVTRTYHLSPVGGLPSVVTLWSTGIVTLHSLTASRSKFSRSKPSDEPLEVQLMWKTSVVPEKYTVLDWLESSIFFIDGIDSGNDNGLIVVTGMLEAFKSESFEEDDEEIDSTLVATIHARTGKLVWRSFLQDRDGSSEEARVALPVQRGSTSAARRRSLIPNLHHHTRGDLLPASQEPQNCLQSSFRRALLTSSSLTKKAALPTSYWTEDDVNSRILHFDLEQPKPHHTGDKKGKKGESDKVSKKVTKHRRKNHRHAVHGRPNVLVTHNMEGLQVRSLKNGRSLCHLGLAEEALYADINHDGNLDSIQIALGSHAVQEKAQEDETSPVSYDADDDLRFISELARKIAKRKDSKGKSIDDDESEDTSPGDTGTEALLCHLVALSGFPSREELYSVNLCGHKYQEGNDNLAAAPPLLVEPRDGERKRYDIVAALNNGLMHRLNGKTGRRQWQLVGKHHRADGHSFPHWDNPERVVLSRVDSPGIVPEMRPILLAGEDGVAIISSQDGQIMASATFPQQSVLRPILVDFNGDGTTDIVVQSKDGIWAFQIVVLTGSSLFLRILLGLLFMSLLLALLSNRFGPKPGKRSTDL